MSADPYAVLGVAPTAPQEELRQAWHALARRHHPDHGGDPAEMQAVNEAWALVGDPARRRVWDRQHGIRTGRPRPAPADGADDPEADLDLDLDLLDPRPLGEARRSFTDVVPVLLFALAVATACLALALDEPSMLGVAVFLFFLSCVAVVAVAMLSMRRSVRAGRR